MEDGDLGNLARQTLEAIQRRVEVEMMSAPIMVCAAMADNSNLSIKGTVNSLHISLTLPNLSVTGMHGSPHLISSGAVGPTGARAMWKSMITNASFRTKKLPDDITVAHVADTTLASASSGLSSSTAPSQSAAVPTTQLSSITEENDDSFAAGIGKSSFRLSELVKKKSKPKSTRSKVNNGTSAQDGSHSSDNGAATLNQSDWQSDGEGHEDVELRGRNNEFNGPTQV